MHSCRNANLEVQNHYSVHVVFHTVLAGAYIRQETNGWNFNQQRLSKLNFNPDAMVKVPRADDGKKNYVLNKYSFQII